MRERISAIVSIVLLTLLIGASYFYAIQSGLRNLRYVPSSESPDYTAKNITLTEFGADGQPVRRLIAENAVHYSDDRMNADNPRYVTLDAKSPQVIASAKHGSTDDGGATVLFSGGVTITREAGNGRPASKFETERLTAYPDTAVFVTDAPVKFTSGRDTMNGTGMTYDYSHSTIELSGRVATHVAPRK